MVRILAQITKLPSNDFFIFYIADNQFVRFGEMTFEC